MDVKRLVKGLLARNPEVMESTMADVEEGLSLLTQPNR